MSSVCPLGMPHRRSLSRFGSCYLICQCNQRAAATMRYHVSGEVCVSASNPALLGTTRRSWAIAQDWLKGWLGMGGALYEEVSRLVRPLVKRRAGLSNA